MYILAYDKNNWEKLIRDLPNAFLVVKGFWLLSLSFKKLLMAL